MNKINWENGTLVSPAKVEIGGVIYEVTPEQYSGNTPLSAENLNRMQNNIEEAIDEVVEGSTGYTKLTDGTLICYGVINQATYPADEWQSHEVSLPQSYKDATYSIQLTIRHDGDGWTNIVNFRADSKNNNTFNIMLHNIGSHPVKIGFSWITIGRWK